ncbi:hypothetical protein DL768_001002 [Monosporascus sp. mg162]|nr:hypothetical protein DL768_001002 [Monosporascus sp. mg162]
MKTSAILVGLSAALAAAQATFPAGFPECGQVCITNMLNMANNFGCGLNPDCLCTRPDFLYGIRDCSNEYCQDPNAAAQSINYGAQYCADAGIAISGLPSNTASATASAYTTVLATAYPTDPATGAGSTGSEGVTSGVAITTDEILSTLTESSVITSTVGSTTVYSTLEPSVTGTSSSGSVVSTTTETQTSVVTTTSGSATESGYNTLSTVVSSTISSVVSSTVALTSSDVTITTTNSEGQTETATVPTTVPVSEDAAGETTEPAEPANLAAQHTAGPVAIMAAAGMAAALLL